MDLATRLQDIFSLESGRTEFDIADAFLQLDEVIVAAGCSTQQLVNIITKHESGVLELLLSSDASTEAAMRIRNFLLKAWPISRSQLPTLQLEILRRLSELFASLPSTGLLPTAITKNQKRAFSLKAVLFALVELQADESGKAFGTPRSPPPSPRASRKMSRASEPEQDVYQKAGFTLPQSLEDFDSLMERCIRECSTITKTYIDHASSTEVAEHAVRQFLSTAKIGKTEKALASLTAFDSNAAGRVGPQNALAYLRDGAEEGKWPIVLAHRALKQVRKLASRDTTVFEIVQLRIKELREGYFPPRNQDRFFGHEFGIPLYLAEVNNEMAIVYQIDCGGPANDPLRESQYIRVYDIAKVDPTFWRSVAKQLDRKDKGYQARCNERSIARVKAKGVNVVAPLQHRRDPSATNAVEFSDDKGQTPLGETLSLDLHRILALEKFIPYSLELFEAVKTAKNGTFMFAMSPAERDIIRHDSSCLVLGRSGTGKTTTMLFKMLAYDLAATQEGTSYRQMFVTQSPSLAEKIRVYYDRLRNSSLDMEEDHASQSPTVTDFTLDDISRDTRSTPNSLPLRFSDLQERHFPLFLSFDELCNLLAADLELAFDAEMLSVQTYRPQGTRPAEYRQGLVTFKYFKAELWPKIGVKGFDPMLVYNDFMGVIKGTEETLGGDTGFLDRSSYEALSVRTHPTFASNRRQVYDMFDAYLRLRSHRTYDTADRTHALLKAIRQRGGIPGTPIDFVYVDEVQDNLLIDAALLRQLCPNPHGLFYAGDTAQTVSAGSSFRFNDLKAFLWRLERNEPLVQKGKRTPVDPAFFGLSTNYRSHSGIIQAAAFIVSLLARLFPNSVDQLAPEQALVSGPRPVFFLNRLGETPFNSFVAGDGSTDQQVEFGSDQVIIVRDEAARQRLIQKVGKHAGIVMTLYASKGQEFNDVLLYDFFADSPASRSDWRSLLLAERGSPQSNSLRAKNFDREHAVLQTELKCMYVGVTRARERVWFWDTSDKGDSWKDLMSDSGLATYFEPHQSVPNLAAKSTAKSWALRGKECFGRQDFTNAALCFENAGLAWWNSVATAYESRQAAETLPRDNYHRRKHYLATATLFSECGWAAPTVKDKHTLLTSSARCYSEAEDHKRAADIFVEVQLYNDALHHYRLAGLFDEGMSVIGTHRAILDPDLVKTVERSVRSMPTPNTEAKKTKLAIKSADNGSEFVKGPEPEAQHTAIPQNITRHDRAAGVFLQQQRYPSAISEFLSSTTTGSDQMATTCFLDGLKMHSSVGADNRQIKFSLQDILKLGRRVPMTPDQRQELANLQGRHTSDQGALAKHAEKLFQLNPHLALLYLDAWAEFNKAAPLGRKRSNRKVVVSSLTSYLHYKRLVISFIQPENLLGPDQPLWLFGLSLSDTSLRSTTGGTEQDIEGVVVMPHSIVYIAACEGLERGIGIRLEAGIAMPRSNAAELIQTALSLRLNTFLEPLLEIAFNTKQRVPFDICIRQFFFIKCNDQSCVRLHLDHPTSAKPSSRQIQINMLIIAVLDHFVLNGESPPEVDSRRAQPGRWIKRLFKACYPPSINIGSILGVFPEIFFLVKTWCQAQEVASNMAWLYRRIAAYGLRCVKAINLICVFILFLMHLTLYLIIGLPVFIMHCWGRCRRVRS